MKKKKLIVFPGNFYPHVGGLESHVDNFVNYLSKDYEYDITIFVPNSAYGKDYEIIHKGVKVIRYPAFDIVFNFYFPRFWTFKFWRMFLGLYSKNFDIVMTRTMFFANTTLGGFFAKCRFRRLKLVHVEHASDYSKLDSKFKSFMNKFYMHSLGRLVLWQSDKVIAISTATKIFLHKHFMHDVTKVPVIRRGFDYKKCMEVKSDKSLINKYKGRKIITFVGRLIDGKGVQDILKVLPKIKKDYVFLVVGPGEYSNKLKEIVKKLDLEDNVEFLGKVPHNRVLEILKSTDIFVNPSHTEGLPTTVLDALFAGCKILATDVGGTYEILGKEWKGRYSLIKMKDYFAIEKELNRLLEVKDKVDLDLLNKKSKIFDWEEHAKSYDKEMRSLFRK